MASPRSLLLHLVSFAFAVAIAVALIEPVPLPLQNATQGMAFPIDKLVHFLLFFVAAFPWQRSLARLGVRAPGEAVVAVAALYGGLLEVAQGIWTLRDPEFLDMAAGALGAIVTVGILKISAPRAVEDEKQGQAPVSRTGTGTH